MFREWGFLLTEMTGLLILAALIGLLAGWLIWGRRDEITVTGEGDAALRAERDGLAADLSACRAAHEDKDARIAALEAELMARSEASPAAPVMATAAEPAETAEAIPDYDGDGVAEGTDEGTRPEALSAPRAGGADDLKRIKGIGPKLEALCHRLGFYHFDQIAGWTADEIAWVDANLEGFKGRVSRDNWVAQARLLAEGGETEFSRRVDQGDVYD